MTTPAHKRYTQEEQDSVVDNLYDGVSATDLAAQTGIPLAKIYGWKAKHETPAGQAMLSRRREAFVAVMESYNSIRSVLGQIQAMDYSKMTEGSGTQYGNTNRAHQVIDYQVDVTKAAESVLTPSQLAYFNANLKDQDLEAALQVQSIEVMRLQEKLGRVFLARELYPVSKYFVVTRQ